MAANILGLFVLILGTTGISKMSHAGMADYAPRSYWNRFKSNYAKDDIESLDCRYRYGPYACNNELYNPPNFRTFRDFNVNLKKFPKRNWYIEELPEKMQKLLLEDRVSTVKFEDKLNSNENGYSGSSNSSSESAISSTQPDNSNERHTINFLNYFRRRPSPLSDKSGNPIQSDARLSTDVNLASDLYVSDQTVSDLNISSEPTKDTTGKTSSKDITANASSKNTITKTSSKDSAEYKSSSFIKTFTNSIEEDTTAPQEHLTKSKDEIIQTDSVVFKEKTNLFEEKTNSTVSILSTNNHNSELESTQSQSPSFSTSGVGTSTKFKSNSSDEIHSGSTQSFGTGLVTFQSSTILTNDDTALDSKLSSSSDIESTTVKKLNVKSTTGYFTSSNKFASTPFTDTVTEGDEKVTFSTESTSSKTPVTSENITKDHIIEISSIHTARIVITSIFLVIALIAITVLAVCIFRLKRKTIHYDQLLLLP